MRIGEVARRAELPAKTIRYYEEAGLIRPAERAVNGYRDYGDRDVHTLRFIQRARSLGFSMEACRTLLSLYQDHERSSADVKALARDHLRATAAAPISAACWTLPNMIWSKVLG